MPNPRDFPAIGKIVELRDGVILFHPVGTRYQLQLEAPAQQAVAPSNRPVNGIIRVRARKIWTVPSGGLFIAPIFGSPRTIQGRVRYLDEQQIVVNAGTMLLVELPTADSAYDLANGPIVVGKMLNISALPGARFEMLPAEVPATQP